MYDEKTEKPFFDLCYEWLEIMQNRVKPSTYANYLTKIEKHIIPAFNEKLCRQITRREVYEFMRIKLNEGLSSRYVSDIMVLFKSIFKYAQMEYGIDFTTWDKSIVIVCESMLDAITAWTFNRYAVAMNGLGTDLQFKQLRELPCRQIILATDNDDAGMRARERIRKNVKNKIITEYQFPDGVKDLNDLVNTGFDVLQEYF